MERKKPSAGSEGEAAASAPPKCHVCSASTEPTWSGSCAFCTKWTCARCAVKCGCCDETFCKLCSTKRWVPNQRRTDLVC
eukprot:scaffold748_cov251-Pinguiococcus_pyrenoidosus.AAC.70